MTKTFISLAIAAVAATGFNAAAQDCAAPACTSQQQADKMHRAATPREMAFEGILLSIDQQTKIDAINAEFDAKCAKSAAQCTNEKCTNENCTNANCTKENCDKQDQKCDKKDRKCDKKEQKCAKDSASVACKGHRDGRGNGHRAHQGNRRPGLCPEYIAKVKEVLTPEQYTTFLENIVNMPARMGRPAGQGREDRQMAREARKDAKRVATEARDDAKKVASEAKKDAKKAGKEAKKEAKKGVAAAKKEAKKAEAAVK